MTTSTIQKSEGLSFDQLITSKHSLGFDATLHSALEEVGDNFGLYDIMLNHGPITSGCLATQAGIPERFARLWLNVQAAGNCLGHHAPTDLYGLWCDWPANGDKVS